MPAIDPPVASNLPRRCFDEAAMQRLEVLLIEHAAPLGGLLLEGIDGLFSAAVVAPGATLALPDLLPLALGAREAAAPEELTGLLRLMWDATRHRIASTPEGEITHLLPLIRFPPADELSAADADSMPDEYPIGATWAMGFMLGYGLRRAEWEQRLEADEDLAWEIMDIVALATPLLDAGEDADDGFAPEAPPTSGFNYTDDQLDPRSPCAEHDAGGCVDPDDDGDEWLDPDEDEDDDDDDEPIDREERLDIISDLPSVLHHWHLTATQERISGLPSPDAHRPERDDLCPCGSGRVFKKCHGDPARLH